MEAFEVKTFYMAEYEALRAEILLSLADVRALERYIAVACAGIWSWVAVHPESPRMVLWVPIVLTGLGALRALAYSQDFKSTHEYIVKVEDVLGAIHGSPAPPGGWEHFPKARKGRITFSAIAFWILLLAAGGVAFCKLQTATKEVSKPSVTISCVPIAK